MISSLIFRRPYSLGNPFVDVTTIEVSVAIASDDKSVLPITTSGTKLSTLR